MPRGKKNKGGGGGVGGVGNGATNPKTTAPPAAVIVPEEKSAVYDEDLKARLAVAKERLDKIQAVIGSLGNEKSDDKNVQEQKVKSVEKPTELEHEASAATEVSVGGNKKKKHKKAHNNNPPQGFQVPVVVAPVSAKAVEAVVKAEVDDGEDVSEQNEGSKKKRNRNKKKKQGEQLETNEIITVNDVEKPKEQVVEVQIPVNTTRKETSPVADNKSKKKNKNKNKNQSSGENTPKIEEKNAPQLDIKSAASLKEPKLKEDVKEVEKSQPVVEKAQEQKKEEVADNIQQVKKDWDTNTSKSNKKKNQKGQKPDVKLDEPKITDEIKLIAECKVEQIQAKISEPVHTPLKSDQSGSEQIWKILDEGKKGDVQPEDNKNKNKNKKNAPAPPTPIEVEKKQSEAIVSTPVIPIELKQNVIEIQVDKAIEKALDKTITIGLPSASVELPTPELLAKEPESIEKNQESDEKLIKLDEKKKDQKQNKKQQRGATPPSTPKEELKKLDFIEPLKNATELLKADVKTPVLETICENVVKEDPLPTNVSNKKQKNKATPTPPPTPTLPPTPKPELKETIKPLATPKEELVITKPVKQSLPTQPVTTEEKLVKDALEDTSETSTSETATSEIKLESITLKKEPETTVKTNVSKDVSKQVQSPNLNKKQKKGVTPTPPQTPVTEVNIITSVDPLKDFEKLDKSTEPFKASENKKSSKVATPPQTPKTETKAISFADSLKNEEKIVKPAPTPQTSNTETTVIDLVDIPKDVESVEKPTDTKIAENKKTKGTTPPQTPKTEGIVTDVVEIAKTTAEKPAVIKVHEKQSPKKSKTPDVCEKGAFSIQNMPLPEIPQSKTELPQVDTTKVNLIQKEESAPQEKIPEPAKPVVLEDINIPVKLLDNKPLLDSKPSEAELVNVPLSVPSEAPLVDVPLPAPSPIHEVKEQTKHTKKEEPKSKKEQKQKQNKQKSKAPQPPASAADESPPAPPDIPMDMSIISTTQLEQNASGTSEIVTADDNTSLIFSDSKNVQRSDFVQSVDAVTNDIKDEAKSLISTTTTTNTKESKSNANKVTDVMRETKNASPTSNKRNKNSQNQKQLNEVHESKLHELPEKTAQAKLDTVQVSAVQLMDILEPKMTTPLMKPGNIVGTVRTSPRAEQRQKVGTDHLQAPQQRKRSKSPKEIKAEQLSTNICQKQKSCAEKKDIVAITNKEAENKTGTVPKVVPAKTITSEKVVESPPTDVVQSFDDGASYIQNNIQAPIIPNQKPQVPPKPENLKLKAEKPKESTAKNAPNLPETKTPEKNIVIPPESHAKPPASEEGVKLSTTETTNNKVTANDKSKSKPDIPPRPPNLVSSPQIRKPLINPSPTSPSSSSSATPSPLPFDDEEYVEYKFAPRPVFMCTICHVCKIPLQSFVFCKQCQMIAYCTHEHMVENEVEHKSLCTAIQEIARKRGEYYF